MVAYSFRPRFIAAIESGEKRQTIRADRKRHARAGEQLQLYTGMRTRRCRLLARATCCAVMPIRLDLAEGRIEFPSTGTALTTFMELTEFALQDGFPAWRGPDGMLAFWKAEHGDAPIFSGVMIRWADLDPWLPT